MQTSSRRFRAGIFVAVGGPPLLLAGLGFAHPADLSADTAAQWLGLHIVLMAIFPLLGFAPWLVVRRYSRGWGVVAAALGYVYAVFFSALDILAGIGSAALDLAGRSGVGTLNSLAVALVWPGVYAYLAAAILAAVLALRVHGTSAIIGSVLVVVGAYSWLDSHIYWPRGVLTCIALALGWGLLARLPVHSSPQTSEDHDTTAVQA